MFRTKSIRDGQIRQELKLGTNLYVSHVTGGRGPTLIYTYYLSRQSQSGQRSQPITHKSVKYDKSYPLKKKSLPHSSSTTLVIPR